MGPSMIIDSYSIVVSERVNMQKNKEGDLVQYFNVYAHSTNDTTYPKLEKTYQDFKNLELAINNNLRSNDILCPSLEGTQSEMSGWKERSENELSLTEKISNVKRFCKLLGADPALHCEPFYDFFEIPKTVTYFEGRKSDVEFDHNHLKSTVTAHNMAEMNSGWNDFEKEPTNDYCPYFRVAVMGPPEELEVQNEGGKSTHNYFNFIIKQLADLDNTLNFKKRYTEFYDLAVSMKTLVTARPPPLPPKLMLKDKAAMIKRGEQLEEWLAVTLNEKMFFCPQLFSFIGLDQTAMARYSKLDFIAIMLDSVYFKFTLVDKKSQQSSEESFVTWEILVEVYDLGTKDLVNRYRIFRRFREFDHLHSELKHKFQKNIKPLPELPGKMVYLNILSSHKMEQRQEKLQVYLKQLVDYPGIFNTVCFRKFIELDTRKMELLINSCSKKRS